VTQQTGERYEELLERERERWWSPENFDTWKRLYQSEHARGGYVLALLREMVPELEIPAARVLDVGCGDAGVLIAFAEHGARGVGIEVSERSLVRGAVRAREHGVDVALARASGEDLPYRDESFDVVILDNVLEHVWRPSRVIAESRRVLRRHGILYVVTPKPFTPHSLWSDPHYDLAGLVLLPRGAQRWYFERVRGGSGYDVTHIPTRRRVSRMLAEAGFTLVTPPRDLWIRYLRDRISRPTEIRSGAKRWLAGQLASSDWVFRNRGMRWLCDVAIGSNHFLARRAG
jgi:ubiquinone/menaquinone biosynthesis C-methylase UbiE